LNYAKNVGKRSFREDDGNLLKVGNIKAIISNLLSTFSHSFNRIV